MGKFEELRVMYQELVKAQGGTGDASPQGGVTALQRVQQERQVEQAALQVVIQMWEKEEEWRIALENVMVDRVEGDIRKRYKAQGREEPQGLELGQTARRIVQKMLESALELSECQTQIAQQKKYTVEHLQSELEDRLSQSVHV